MSAAATLTAQRILVLVGRLRVSWAWTDEQVQPGPVRFHERQLTASARARLDRLVLAERADRTAILKSGAVPRGDTAAPLRIGVADARTDLHTAVEAAAYLTASNLRNHIVIPFRVGWTTRYHRTGSTVDQRVAHALDYLADNVALVDHQRTLDQIERDLDHADRRVRAAVGVGADRRLIKAACPACGRRALAAEVGSPRPSEWAILCTAPGCRCRGLDCGCRRPVRWPSGRHIWPETEWGALARLLDHEVRSAVAA